MHKIDAPGACEECFLYIAAHMPISKISRESAGHRNQSGERVRAHNVVIQ